MGKLPKCGERGLSLTFVICYFIFLTVTCYLQKANLITFYVMMNVLTFSYQKTVSFSGTQFDPIQDWS